MNERKKISSMKGLPVAAFIVILLLLSGCISHSHISSVKIVSITPNKTVYHSGELMKLNITLKASSALDNITINITGLENKIGQIILNKYIVVRLVKGINNLIFEYTMPSCSSCKKLDLGTYPINVTVSYNGKIIAKGTKDIQLER